MGDMDGFRAILMAPGEMTLPKEGTVLEELTFECVQGKICRLDNL